MASQLRRSAYAAMLVGLISPFAVSPAFGATSFLPAEVHHAVPADAFPPVTMGGIAVTDIDTDGRDDVISVAGETATVWRSAGDGDFVRSDFPTSGSAATQPLVADVDGDSTPDLLINDLGQDALLLLPGDGSGGFGAGRAIVSDMDPGAVAVGQFGGDGKPDVAVTRGLEDELIVFVQGPSGSFEPEWTVPAGELPHQVEAADLDGDGRLDLVTRNVGSNDVAVSLQQATGGFAASVSYAVGSEPRGMQLVDLGDDDAIDVVTTHADGTAWILQGTGDGEFANGSVETVGGHTVRDVLADDLDADGDVDLVFPVALDYRTTRVLLQDADGAFELVDAGLLQSGALSSALGDLDGDDEADLLSAQLGGWSVSYGDVLAVEPYAVDFGAWYAGFGGIESFIVRNTGSVPTVPGAAAIDEGADEYSIENDGCTGVTLDVRESCMVEVGFDAPEVDGAEGLVGFEGTARVAGDSTSGPRYVPLLAHSYQPVDGFLVPEELELDFDFVSRHAESARRTARFWNDGETGLAMAGATAADGFKIVADGCRDRVLEPFESCAVDIVFAPVADTSRVASGQLVVNASAPPSTASVLLSGTTDAFVRVPTRPLSRFRPPASTGPVVPYAAIERDLVGLVAAVSRLVRGGSARSLRLPEFSTPVRGRLTLTLYGWSKGRWIRLGGGSTVFAAPGSDRLKVLLHKRAINLLRRPKSTRVRAGISFGIKGGPTLRKASTFRVKPPAAKRKRR